jgi:hypothetical protein
MGHSEREARSLSTESYRKAASRASPEGVGIGEEEAGLGEGQVWQCQARWGQFLEGL